MNDLLGYQMCQKIEKTTLSKLDGAFSEDDFSKEYDNRNVLLLGIFMAYYGYEHFKTGNRTGIFVQRYIAGERKFLVATSPDCDYYKRIDGIRYRFFGATVNKNDDVKVIFINDKDDSMVVEYYPLLSIKLKYDFDTFRYYFEKQYAFDYLETALNTNLVKGWELGSQPKLGYHQMRKS